MYTSMYCLVLSDLCGGTINLGNQRHFTLRSFTTTDVAGGHPPVEWRVGPVWLELIKTPEVVLIF